MRELMDYDALGLAALVRAGEVTAAELVDETIARIERVNPRLNAVVTPMYERARAQAARPLDPTAPFAGVPLLLKDIIAAVQGVPLTSGCRALRDFVPDVDSELVRRFRQAGFVAVAKTNVPELGLVATTESALFGPCRNPWSLGHTTGGSSGGAAASVAAGIVPVAHASDGGGSIRIPAACCGVFGLKPTRARVSLAPTYGDIMGGMVVEHVVSRSVRDSAAVLDAIAGPVAGDPYAAPPLARPLLEETQIPPGRLRVALSRQTLGGSPLHPECAAALEDAARLCEALGHDVEEATPELDTASLLQAFIGLWAASTTASLEAMTPFLGRAAKAEDVEPFTWALAELGRAVPAWQTMLATAMFQQTTRRVAAFMAHYDVLLMPALAEPPVALGEIDVQSTDVMAVMMRMSRFVPFTALFNITGQPAMSVPLAQSAAGLPLGAQFVGRFGDEATLFRLAAQLEAARPWAARRPPVWAS